MRKKTVKKLWVDQINYRTNLVLAYKDQALFIGSYVSHRNKVSNVKWYFSSQQFQHKQKKMSRIANAAINYAQLAASQNVVAPEYIPPAFQYYHVTQIPGISHNADLSRVYYHPKSHAGTFLMQLPISNPAYSLQVRQKKVVF